MAERVTTVLIGCGGRGVRAHGSHAVKSEKVRLVAVCDLDDQRREAAAAELGVEGVKDYRDLLNRSDVHSVIVATNAKYHAPIALDAIRAGKHVLIEKPLAEDAASARTLVEAAEKHGVIGMVGYQFRFSPFGEALKREVEEIEPLQALMTVQRGPMARQYFFPEHYGGVVDTATHTIHMAEWLMGGPPEAVYGSVHRGSMVGDETIEFMNLMMEYEGGKRTATVISSMFGMQAANLVQVIGRRGHVSSTDRKALRVVRHGGQLEPRGGAVPGMESRTIDTGGGMEAATGAMIDHFGDLISGAAKQNRGTSLREGMFAVAVTQAMVQAATSGRRVSLGEVVSK
ncbi:MAG TPA: Gfo/Idh/MocA family oxidoreductase [Chloroflexota bacterium]|nr:Gfo/Idh/MocA family oxidoreductase [Chloroflexota bacterium]